MTNSKNSIYIKSGLWYTVGNILIKGISFLALPIFTRILSPDDFGKYNVFLSYENILQVIIGLGLSGTIKVAYFDYKGEFNKYFSSIVSFTFFTTLIFDLLANLFILLFVGTNLPSFWTVELVNILVFSSLSNALYALISTRYVIEAKYKANLAMSFTYTILSVLFSVLLCLTLFSTQRYLGRIIGQVLPLVVMTMSISIVYVTKYRSIINWSHWVYALKLGLPLILHMLSMVLLMQIGKLVIDNYLGSAITGIYSVAVTIAGILTVLLVSFDNAWAPWFYRGLAGEEGINLVNGNNKISILFAFVTSVFILISPEIVRIMSSKEYHDAIYSLVPLIIAVFINFMYLFAVNQEYFYKKTKTIAIGTVVATICCTGIDFLFIPVFGYLTAAYADMIGKGVLYLIHTLVVRKMNKEDVVSNRLLLILLLALCIVGGGTLLLKDLLLIRLALVLMLTIFIAKPIRQYIVEFKQQIK